jgi:hypothetical protein
MRSVLASALSAVACGRTCHGPATLATLRARSCGTDRLTGGARVAMHSKRTAALVASLAVALAACGGDDDVEPIAEPSPTETAAPTEEPEPDEPDATEDPEPEDPFAVPDEIDEPYVQSVLDELFALRSDALRGAVEAHGDVGLPEDVATAVGASHEGPWRLRTVEQLEALQTADNLEEVFRAPDEMGNERFILDRIVAADESCIVATGLVDSSAVNLAPPNTDLYSVVALSPVTASSDLNPTPWLLYDESYVLFDGDPADTEVVDDLELEDLGPLLDATCGVE